MTPTPWRTAAKRWMWARPACACRRLAAAAWPHPLIVADRQTIVTGDEALLRGLARRTDAHLESAPLDRLLSAMNPEADAMLLVDLAAVRAARWKLPTALADVWPMQKRMWHDLWETPAGLGCTLWWSESPRSELALVCESETTTQKVYADLDELRSGGETPAGEAARGDRRAGNPTKRPPPIPIASCWKTARRSSTAYTRRWPTASSGCV